MNTYIVVGSAVMLIVVLITIFHIRAARTKDLEKQQLLNELRRVRVWTLEGNYVYGICSTLSKPSLFLRYARRWARFSGDPIYPVPHPEYEPQPAYTYAAAKRGPYFWDKRTEYGQARWELLDFVINQLEQEL